MKFPCVRIAWWVVLALTSWARGAEATAPVWRIMAVGDSITEGGATFSVYRPLLAEKLRAAGVPFEFVGTRGTASLRHEGYGGKTIEFVAATVPTHFAETPADIVLLHGGHNHFVEEKPIPGIVAATERLIAALRAQNPRVIVLVAQVIPSGKLPKYSYIPELNVALAQLVARLHTLSQPVLAVDQATGFDWNTDTIADRVHPNAAGAEKMAQRWLAALTPILARPPPAPAISIHVAPQGDDAAPGTAAQPVATPARAQQLARAARAAGRPVVVTLYGGIYYLPEPLVFTAADAGTAETPVVWQARAGETPVLSGGARLALAWRPSSFGSGVFEAAVPAGLELDQLWINGQRQWMARFPNREAGEDLNVFDTWKLDHRAPLDPARDALAPARIARWSDPAGGYLHALHPALWGGVHWRITGKNPDGALARIGGTQNNRGAALHKTYRMVENIREELDAPGEWFHEAAARLLYYLPPAGTALGTATVETVRLRHLIEIRGTAAAPVRGLHFAGFTFRHTARTFMETKEPLLRSDWTIYRGGAVFATGTEDCTVVDCTFDQVGGNAIFASDYQRRFTVRGCVITEAGANGVCFVGNPSAVRNALFHYDQRLPFTALDRAPGPKSDDYPADCLVEDCLITRTGRVEKQTAGVAIDMARSITVRHCSIYDVPRAGINIGGGTWGGHVVEHCDVFDTVKETGDHGSFNSWGRDRFWTPNIAALDDDATFAAHRDLPLLDAVQPVTLRHNRWRCDHGWDIDLDDGSSNYVIRDNLCLGGGIKNREGFFRIVENNIVAGSGFHPHVWYKHGGDIVRRNIFAAAYLPARMGPPPWGAEMDFNFLHAAGAPQPTPAAKLAAQSGRDAHSITGDAQFFDPAQGDFRVRPTSPALALGFVNFAMDDFGVRPPDLKARARSPSFAPRRSATVTWAAPAPAMWLGATVKNLTTAEEASSVGVALAAGGVLVVTVPPGSPAARAGLQAGDLVIALAGSAVKTTADLRLPTAAAEAATRELTVVREQAPRRLILPVSMTP